MSASNRIILATAVGVAWLAPVLAQVPPPDAYGGKYTPCVAYSTVGESRCAPKQPLPVPALAPRREVAAPAPAVPDPAQQFLDNHGKPPREFAEFYVNPTPENAQRWVTAFRAQQAKATSLANAWREAERAATPAATLTTAATTGTATAAPVGGAAPALAPTSASATLPRAGLRLGAFATPAQSLPQLVYYFSASCPFCTRLKPDLAAFTQQNIGKLTFTCVDLTPLSPRQAPAPSNREGLPCDWRLPNPNEVERLQLRQTPTLLASRPDGTGQRLSGVITPAQLQAAVFDQ